MSEGRRPWRDDFARDLRAVIAAVAACEQPRAPEAGVAAWRLPRTRERPRERERYGHGMHAHDDHRELCVAVAGEGILDLAAHRYALRAPALAAIGTGVAHSEGYARLRQGYTAVWISPLRDADLVMRANRYQPGHGWSMPWTLPLTGELADGLCAWFGATNEADDETFLLMRCGLLAELGRLLGEHLAGRGPAAGEDDGLRSDQRAVLRWVRQYLDARFAEPLTLDTVAARTRYSPKYLDSLFARWTGQGIRAYLIERRLQQGRRLCRDSDLPIQDIAQRVGYEDPLYFSKAYRKRFGHPPSYERGGRGG